MQKPTTSSNDAARAVVKPVFDSAMRKADQEGAAGSEPGPHVCVVMAVYNGAATVGTAIDSICRQTYTNWRLVIVDDGSTDGTPKALETAALADPRITVIRIPANKGLAAALNIGWRHSNGEIIVRMDADDFSYADRIERQLAFLENHADVDVLGTAADIVDEQGHHIGIQYRPEWHEEIVRSMYRLTPFIHPSVMMRRRFLESMGGYEESEMVLRAEDADLWLRGYRRFRYHNLQEPLIKYRLRRKPLMRSFWGSAYVQLHSAYCEGMVHSKGWYALRTLVAGALEYLHLYDSTT